MSYPERVTAWIYTGPLGHLYGTAADVIQLWVAYLASRARLRLRDGAGPR
jgi:hypothetical protein